MNAARRHERFLIVVIAAVFVIAIGAVQVIANRANERDASNAVAACERGNDIRDYLAFDNEERITRIETRLTSTNDPPARDEVAELKSEVARRYDQQLTLRPFDCDSLR